MLQVLVVAPEKVVPMILKSIGPYSSAANSKLRNLGVIFDQSASFDTKQLTRSCFFHLRDISKLRSVVSTPDLEMIIHAFISSRIDYCNALFSSLSLSAVSPECSCKTSLPVKQMVPHYPDTQITSLAPCSL